MITTEPARMLVVDFISSWVMVARVYVFVRNMLNCALKVCVLYALKNVNE